MTTEEDKSVFEYFINEINKLHCNNQRQYLCDAHANPTEEVRRKVCVKKRQRITFDLPLEVKQGDSMDFLRGKDVFVSVQQIDETGPFVFQYYTVFTNLGAIINTISFLLTLFDRVYIVINEKREPENKRQHSVVSIQELLCDKSVM